MGLIVRYYTINQHSRTKSDIINLNSSREVGVAEAADELFRAVDMAKDYFREVYAVERVVLDHRVNRHVAKNYGIALTQPVFERIYANFVTGKASRSAKAVDEWGIRLR